jgi:hypothetical protein
VVLQLHMPQDHHRILLQVGLCLGHHSILLVVLVNRPVMALG